MDLYFNEIKSFLQTNRKFIFCDIDSDCSRLPIRPYNVVDIQQLFNNLKGIKKASLLRMLGNLYNHNFKLVKPNKIFYNEFLDKSKLNIRDLSKNHINYMMADAYITLCIYYKLKFIINK